MAYFCSSGFLLSSVAKDGKEYGYPDTSKRAQVQSRKREFTKLSFESYTSRQCQIKICTGMLIFSPLGL